MPYSHLRWMAKERLESTTRQRMTTNCFSDLASAERPDTDFSELVWENGQILMQGQPSKGRKGSSNTNTQEKEQDRALPNPKTAHSVVMNDNSTRHLGLANDDELGHWLDYPLDEYSSQFFSEFNQNFAVPVVKDGKDAHPCSSHSVPTNRSKLVDSTSCNTNIDQQPHYEKSNNVPLHSKLQTQPSKNAGVANFSHFLRSAPVTKTNRQNVDGASGSSSLGIDKARLNDKGAVASCSNHVQSTIVSTIDSRSPTVLGSKLNTNTSDVRPPVAVPPMETLTIESSHTDNHGDALEKSKAPDQAQTLSFAASTPVGRPEKEKYVEPVAAPSSVCSGNVTSGASDDMSNRFKRKYRETEESDYPSEDVEEDSVVVRKPVTARGGSSAKRTRAAEVHNLSERRRRDRINEKMRALQELIPNCNKVDKASMLDEAIEYLKTLQLQVQIMSMGTGLFMPPMMLPHGMQHVNAPHLTPFSPVNAGMGMGMGMGMNFGMGMVDFSGSSSGCPLIQMPPIHGQQFPYTPMSGPSSFPHMAGSNLQMFGPPGRGFPMPMPHAPFIPPPGGVSLKPNSLPVVSGVATPTEVPNLANPSCSKDPEENMNEPVPNTNAESSQDQMPSQGAKKSFGLPVVERRHDQPPQSSGNKVIDTA